MIAIVRDVHYKEIKRVLKPTKNWMLEQLENHVCLILFRKKLTGTFRSLKCTRDLSKLPKKYKVKYAESIDNPHGYDDIIPVWEVATRDWKSFYYPSVYSFTVLLGED